MISLTILLASMTSMVALWIRVVGINFSLSSIMMSGLVVLHGPAYLYYTRVWGPRHGLMREIYDSITPGARQAENFFDHVLSFASDRNVINDLDLALALLFVSFCIGLMLFDRLPANSASRMRECIKTWEHTEIPTVSPKALSWITPVLVSCACIALVLAVQENQVGRVLQYFHSNAGEFEKIAMRRALGGSPHYLYNLALAALLPLIALWGLAIAPQSPRLISPWAFFLAALVLLGKLATLSKAPPAFFFLQLIALAVIRRRLQLKPIPLLLLTSIALLLLVGMSHVANVNLGNSFNTLIFLFYRVFMIPNESLVEYFSAIPSVIEHTAGRDSRWLTALLHHEPLPATYSRVADVFRDIKGVSTTNAMFLADAWAAFSWTGVAVTGFFAGFGLRAIDTLLIVRWGKSAATVAALTAGLFGVFVALSTAFQTALLTGGLLLLIPFALAARKLEALATK